MKEVLKVLGKICWIVAAIVLLPALVIFGLGVGGTIIGLVFNPGAMLWICGIIFVLSIPGIILGLIMKK